MKKFLIFIVLGCPLFTTVSFSQKQNFGNEWVNTSQTYFKIPIAERGIYRITGAQLTKAGVPSSVDPTTLQLFHRGKEQSIFIEGEADLKLDDTDFLEFYGIKNDGTQDSVFYFNSKKPINPYFNLYSDSTAYFLTWKLDKSKGKRMAVVQENNSQSLKPEPFHLEERIQQFLGDYSPGNSFPIGFFNWNNVFYTHYDDSEGWSSGQYGSTVMFKSINTLDYLVRTGPKPLVEYFLLGRSPAQHSVNFYAGNIDNPRFLSTKEFLYYDPLKVNLNFEMSDIALDNKVTLGSMSKEANDTYSYTYTKMIFPQEWRMDGLREKQFILPKGTGNKAYIEVKNVSANTLLYDITDRNTAVRILPSQQGNVLSATLNRLETNQNIYASSQFKAIPQIRKVVMRDVNVQKTNYLIISHKKLMSSPSGTNPVRDYATYRASAAGGGYDTLIVTMEEINNLFNYGEFSPVAVRSFANYMVTKGKAQFLFLIGTGWWSHRVRYAPNRYDIDMIPISGWPGADIPLVTGLNNDSMYDISLPIGRLSTDSPQTVLNYLNKVKEHESSTGNGIWRKNILHLSGGKNIGELIIFKEIVNDFQKIGENSPTIAVKTTTLTKKTDEPVEFINVTDFVNKGVGVINFFGHSGGSSSDIDIGFVSNEQLGYNNKGKYPLVIINGCGAGNVFVGEKLFSSDWLNTPEKGAILFLAHTYGGYVFPLKDYTSTLYKYMFSDSIYSTKPFGVIQQRTVKEYLSKNPTFFEIAHAQQILLQGDPAVALYPATKPDYAIDKSSLLLKSYNNTPVTAASDSFRLGVIVSNLGRLNKQKLSLSVSRTLGDGTKISYPKAFYNAVSYQDTLYFTLKNAGLNGGGNNNFEVTIDAENAISEITKTNNATALNISIAGAAATVLFPIDYGVINTQENARPTVNILAQATPLYAGEKHNYQIELDTTATFLSGFKQSITQSSSFLIAAKLNLLAKDSTVYFWRIKDADKPESSNNQWVNASFTFIKNTAEGWSQGKSPQFTKVYLDKLQANFDKNPTWDFKKATVKLNVKVLGGGIANGYLQTFVSLNDIITVTTGNCGNNLLQAVAFERGTLRPYSAFPDLLCGTPPFSTNKLLDFDILYRDLLDRYISAIPKGDYVMMFSAGNISFDKWTKAQRQKMAEIGADTSQLLKLGAGSPFLILGQKGAGKAIITLLPDTKTAANLQSLELKDYLLTDRLNEGSVTSSLIGPASEWGSFSSQVVQNQASQQNAFDVIGIDTKGNESILIRDLRTQKALLQNLDAKQFPFLKLRWNTSNSAFGNPAQLDRWTVSYKGVPEGLINLSSSKKDYANIIKAEGENFGLNFSFKNISTKNFTDSIQIKQEFFNGNTRKKTTNILRTKRLIVGDSVVVSVPVNTFGLAGDNLLTLFFNPFLQQEQYFTNNTIEVPFGVIPDKINPILEVAFDGRQIQNNETVSPNPLITIRLTDENKYLIRKDTLGLDLFFQKSCEGCKLERLSFKNPNLKWRTTASNEFFVEYSPKNLPNGNTYKLQVQGRDLTGNLAGMQPYSIGFKVKNEQEIEDFAAYPNPLTAYGKFVVKLSGADIPDDFSIKVYNQAGLQVREFNPQNSPLRIGTNEILWDGNSDNGLSLPNGLYVYKLTLKRQGQDVPLNQANEQKTGKILIFR